jgi:4-amino-4-deoxy-L-arabinose transferase-like glycosyltransferase
VRYRIFGVHEWTARLWPVLSTLLSIGFLGYVGARVGGTSVGVYTIAVTVGNVGYVIASHVLTLDGSLTAWLTVTFGAFLLAQQRDIDACAQRMWMWVAWIAAAGATLTKGPVAVLIPTASLVLYSILTRDLSPWRRLHGFSGLAIFLGLVAPWFVAAARGERRIPALLLRPRALHALSGDRASPRTAMVVLRCRAVVGRRAVDYRSLVSNAAALA